MSSGERSFYEVIDEKIASFNKSNVNPNDLKYRYLIKLKRLVANGVLLSMSDIEFLKSVSTDSLIPKCDRMSPTGKCLIGMSTKTDERCQHYGNWKSSSVDCDGYDPEDNTITRFGG